MAYATNLELPPITSKKLPTEDENILDSQVEEHEVIWLQRQYRHMQSNLARRMNTEKKPTKQEHIKQILLNELNNIAKDASVTISGNKQKDNIRISEMKTILFQHTHIQDDVQIRKQYIDEIEMQIRMVKKQIVQSMRMMNRALLMNQDRILQGRSNVAKMENKLEVYTRRYCSIQSENKFLRNEINFLMQERQRFNKGLDRFFARLNASKMYMNDLIDQVTCIYKKREEACHKRDLIRRKFRADTIHFSGDMQNLKYVIQMQQNLQQFLSTKSQKRLNYKMLQRKVDKIQMHVIKLKQNRTEQVHVLEEIKELAEEDNVHDIIKQYINMEQDNLLLLDYISHMGWQMDTIQASTENCRNQIDERCAEKQDRYLSQQNTLDSLKVELKVSTEEADKLQQRVDNTKFTLDVIYFGLGRLFQVLRCDVQEERSSLGMILKHDDDKELTTESVAYDNKMVSYVSAMVLGSPYSIGSKASDFPIDQSRVARHISGHKIGFGGTTNSTMKVGVSNRISKSSLRYTQRSTGSTLFKRRATRKGNFREAEQRKVENISDIKTMINQQVINMYNVFQCLAILETKIVDLIRKALWLQMNEIVKENAFVNSICVASQKIHMNIENILTPCPICFENTQLITLSEHVTSVLGRREVEKRIARSVMAPKRDSMGRLIAFENTMVQPDMLRHHVSKCNLPEALKVTAKRFE